MHTHRLSLVLAAALVVAASAFPVAPLAGQAAAAPATTESRVASIHDLATLAALDRLEGIDFPVLLRAEKLELAEVFRMIADAAGIEVRFAGPQDRPLTVRVVDRELPVREVLERLAAQNGLSYEVPDPRTLIVRVPWLAGMDGVTNPRIVLESKVEPVYPARAKQERVEGQVVLEAVIDRAGAVRSIEVLREGPQQYGFAESAVEAVSQWRYEPAERDGEPVEVVFTIAVHFALEPRASEADPLVVRQ